MVKTNFLFWCVFVEFLLQGDYNEERIETRRENENENWDKTTEENDNEYKNFADEI